MRHSINYSALLRPSAYGKKEGLTDRD